MLAKIEARILIFPGTDFHFPSTSVPSGTFLGSVVHVDFQKKGEDAHSPVCVIWALRCIIPL